VINATTAKALNVAAPSPTLLQADEFLSS